MAHVYLFADATGDFAFNARESRYLIIGSVTLEDYAIGGDLLDLRPELTMRGRVHQATILDKTKTLPRLAQDHLRFYKQAWYLHFQYVGPRVVGSKDDLLVVASALQVNRKKAVLGHAVRDVVQQIVQARSASASEAMLVRMS